MSYCVCIHAFVYFVADIEPKANKSVVEDAHKQTGKAEKPLWTRSDNSFKFNFLSEGSSATKEDTSSSDGNVSAVKSTGLTALTGQGSGFAFNFQIPSVSPEDMKTETVPPALLEDTAVAPGSQRCAKEGKPSNTQDSPTSDPSVLSKAKKNKKSGKKKAPESSEGQQKTSSMTAAAEESHGDDGISLVSVKLIPLNLISVIMGTSLQDYLMV